jgi:hypothetical protein
MIIGGRVTMQRPGRSVNQSSAVSYERERFESLRGAMGH